MPSSGNDALRFDVKGNLYVSHSGDFGATGLSGTLVRKITVGGTVSTYVNDLKGALGTNFDSQGNMYIANYNNGEIYKKSPHGKQSIFVDMGSTGFASGITINKKDELYIASYAGNVIFKVDIHGAKQLWVEDKRFDGPVGIVMDEDDNIYVGNYNNGKVFKIDHNKVITELSSAPVGLGYITYTNGMIYGTGYSKNIIYKIPTNGSAVQVLEGSAEADFKFPNGITASNDGKKLYVSNYQNNKIIVIEDFE
jgi:DNA-binding beta-propeller fold protein YncE